MLNIAKMDTPKSEKKLYSMEEIRQLAPGYRGKPENFDPRKVGQKTRMKTKSAKPTTPTALQKNEQPSEQKNDLLLAESIFGVDVTIIAIDSREDFSTSFTKLSEIAVETYNQCAIDERQIDRVLAKEEMSYYATSLLWLKLIDVKVKQGRVALTSEERSLRKSNGRDGVQCASTSSYLPTSNRSV